MRLLRFLSQPSRRRPLAIRQIQGHSMMPVLPPGTIVLGWRWFVRLKPGDTVIFRHNGKEKIKRIGELADGKIFVLGDHSETSTDSRHFGWLATDVVIAKVFWPHAPRHRAENVEQ